MIKKQQVHLIIIKKSLKHFLSQVLRLFFYYRIKFAFLICSLYNTISETKIVVFAHILFILLMEEGHAITEFILI